MHRLAAAIAIVVALSACASGATAPAGVPPAAQAAVVSRHVDGDTIWVRVDEPGGPLPAGAEHKIRLLEIDTPEVNPEPECYGPEASAYAQRQMPLGSTVHLVADREDTDRYGRFLRYLWTAGGTFYNHDAVREGYARAVLYEPNDAHIEQLRAAEVQARGEGAGLWGACPTVHG